MQLYKNKSNQKKTNLTPFEGHFGRQCNTTASNTTNKPDSINLSNNKITKKYLDEDTILDRSYLSELQWADTGMCSNLKVEKFICAAKSKTHAQKEKKQDDESLLMWSEGFSQPIPRTERKVQVKIAGMINATGRQKLVLNGLCLVLAPGRTVGKVSPATKIIQKKPNKAEVRVRNSKLAKFGTRYERPNQLGVYRQTINRNIRKDIRGEDQKPKERSAEKKCWKQKGQEIQKVSRRHKHCIPHATSREP